MIVAILLFVCMSIGFHVHFIKTTLFVNTVETDISKPVKNPEVTIDEHIIIESTWLYINIWDLPPLALRARALYNDLQ